VAPTPVAAAATGSSGRTRNPVSGRRVRPPLAAPLGAAKPRVITVLAAKPHALGQAAARAALSAQGWEESEVGSSHLWPVRANYNDVLVSEGVYNSKGTWVVYLDGKFLHRERVAMFKARDAFFRTLCIRHVVSSGDSGAVFVTTRLKGGASPAVVSAVEQALGVAEAGVEALEKGIGLAGRLTDGASTVGKMLGTGSSQGALNPSGPSDAAEASMLRTDPVPAAAASGAGSSAAAQASAAGAPGLGPTSAQTREPASGDAPGPLGVGADAHGSSGVGYTLRGSQNPLSIFDGVMGPVEDPEPNRALANGMRNGSKGRVRISRGSSSAEGTAVEVDPWANASASFCLNVAYPRTADVYSIKTFGAPDKPLPIWHLSVGEERGHPIMPSGYTVDLTARTQAQSAAEARVLEARIGNVSNLVLGGVYESITSQSHAGHGTSQISPITKALLYASATTVLDACTMTDDTPAVPDISERKAVSLAPCTATWPLADSSPDQSVAYSITHADFAKILSGEVVSGTEALSRSNLLYGNVTLVPLTPDSKVAPITRLLMHAQYPVGQMEVQADIKYTGVGTRDVPITDGAGKSAMAFTSVVGIPACQTRSDGQSTFVFVRRDQVTTQVGNVGVPTVAVKSDVDTAPTVILAGDLSPFLKPNDFRRAAWEHAWAYGTADDWRRAKLVVSNFRLGWRYSSGAGNGTPHYGQTYLTPEDAVIPHREGDTFVAVRRSDVMIPSTVYLSGSVGDVTYATAAGYSGGSWTDACGHNTRAFSRGAAYVKDTALTLPPTDPAIEIAVDMAILLRPQNVTMAEIAATVTPTLSALQREFFCSNLALAAGTDAFVAATGMEGTLITGTKDPTTGGAAEDTEDGLREFVAGLSSVQSGLGFGGAITSSGGTVNTIVSGWVPNTLERKRYSIASRGLARTHVLYWSRMLPRTLGLPASVVDQAADVLGTSAIRLPDPPYGGESRTVWVPVNNGGGTAPSAPTRAEMWVCADPAKNTNGREDGGVALWTASRLGMQGACAYAYGASYAYMDEFPLMAADSRESLLAGWFTPPLTIMGHEGALRVMLGLARGVQGAIPTPWAANLPMGWPLPRFTCDPYRTDDAWSASLGFPVKVSLATQDRELTFPESTPGQACHVVWDGVSPVARMPPRATEFSQVMRAFRRGPSAAPGAPERQ